MGIWRKEAPKTSFRALHIKREAKNILKIPHPCSFKKRHPLKKPHFPTLMEEVPSNEGSCKSFSKMNSKNTKYVQNYCNRKNPSTAQNLLPSIDHKAEISIT